MDVVVVVRIVVAPRSNQGGYGLFPNVYPPPMPRPHGLSILFHLRKSCSFKRPISLAYCGRNCMVGLESHCVFEVPLTSLALSVSLPTKKSWFSHQVQDPTPNTGNTSRVIWTRLSKVRYSASPLHSVKRVSEKSMRCGSPSIAVNVVTYLAEECLRCEDLLS